MGWLLEVAQLWVKPLRWRFTRQAGCQVIRTTHYQPWLRTLNSLSAVHTSTFRSPAVTLPKASRILWTWVLRCQDIQHPTTTLPRAVELEASPLLGRWLWALAMRSHLHVWNEKLQLTSRLIRKKGRIQPECVQIHWFSSLWFSFRPTSPASVIMLWAQCNTPTITVCVISIQVYSCFVAAKKNNLSQLFCIAQIVNTRHPVTVSCWLDCVRLAKKKTWRHKVWCTWSVCLESCKMSGTKTKQEG